MLPVQWVTLQALPINPNGKLDRSALPRPERNRLDTPDYRLPADEVEALLCRIWVDVLGVQPVGVDDDFFELGGHSLLAMRLFTRIEEISGRRSRSRPRLKRRPWPVWRQFSVAPLLKQPAPCRLVGTDADSTFGRAAAILLRPQLRRRGIRPRAPGGRHGRQPTVLWFTAWWAGWDCRAVKTRIADMAGYYLEAIRAHQPHGPYYLGGFCFGGVVAYEIARLIQAQGEQVAVLALIDAGAPGFVKIHSRVFPDGGS